MQKINKSKYKITTLSQVGIGSANELLKNIDFELNEKNIKLKENSKEIRIDDILFDKKGKIESLNGYEFLKKYYKIDDKFLEGYYVFYTKKIEKKDKNNQPLKSKQLLILVNEKDLEEFQEKVGHKDFILSKDEDKVEGRKLIDIRNDNNNIIITFTYYNNLLSNPIITFPYDGQKYYIPGSSLKGALLSNYKSNTIDEQKYDRIIFNDISIQFEDLIISSPYLIQDNKVTQNKNENKKETVKKIKKNINNSNNKMYITKGSIFTTDLDNTVDELFKAQTIKGKNLNEQTVFKIDNTIKFIEDYLVKNTEAYEKYLEDLIETLDKEDKEEKEKLLKEFQRENLEADLKEIISKLTKHKEMIQSDTNAHYFFIGNNKKLVLSANNMENIKDSGFAFDKNFDIFGLVKIERID